MSSQVWPEGEHRSAQRGGELPSQSESPLVGGRAVPPKRLWWLAAGFGVWCSALVFLYALHAIGCVFAWNSSTLRLWLALVFLAHLAVVGWMWRNFARHVPDPALGPTGNVLHAAIVWTAIAAFVATVLTFGPPLLLATCI